MVDFPSMHLLGVAKQGVCELTGHYLNCLRGCLWVSQMWPLLTHRVLFIGILFVDYLIGFTTSIG
jgi:hypothetical protein